MTFYTYLQPTPSASARVPILVAQNRKSAVDADLFNQVLPQGDYAAEIVGSDVIWKESPFGGRNIADVLLRIVCRNKWGIYKTTLKFRVHDLDQGKQHRGRVKVGGLGAAMRLETCDDSEQLHGIPFMLTVWNDWRDKPMRFTCRPAPECCLSPSVGDLLGDNGGDPKAS